MVQAYNRRTGITQRRAAPVPFEYNHATSYGNRRWRDAAAAWLREYPFCILCLAHGRINEGAQDFALTTQRNLVVDHIVPHNDDVNLFWDQDNWQTLCRYPCHDKHKSRCEHQNKDWWHYVRSVINEHKTQDFIDKHAQWLPEHVLEALQCAERWRSLRGMQTEGEENEDAPPTTSNHWSHRSYIKRWPASMDQCST